MGKDCSRNFSTLIFQVHDIFNSISFFFFLTKLPKKEIRRIILEKSNHYFKNIHLYRRFLNKSQLSQKIP